MKIGVLSDSIDHLSESQASGEIGPVTVLPGQSGTGLGGVGEGTAMLEILHDLAPDAELYFATGFADDTSFYTNILNLRSNGCDIIVDDVNYYNESPFQDGLVAQAVNTVTADGALFFSAAQNSGNYNSGTSGTWEGDFLDGGAVTLPQEDARIHNFGSVLYNTVAPGGGSRHLDLFWTDPLGASTNDYDVFVLDSSGSSVVSFGMDRQDGTEDPYEFVPSINIGERIVIVKYSGESRFLHLDVFRGRLSIGTQGAVIGHAGSDKAFAIAAVNANTAFPNSFTGGVANPVESFSSDGPRRVFFYPDGSPITPGDYSSTGGAVRQKPDFAAADSVSTSVPGFTSFAGTSASAPHAAAIAALLLSYNHSLTSAQIRTIFETTALDVAAPGPDRDSGYGVLMASDALQ